MAILFRSKIIYVFRNGRGSLFDERKDREQGDLISLLLFFQNKGSRLIKDGMDWIDLAQDRDQ
jgi:hypothetical protein